MYGSTNIVYSCVVINDKERNIYKLGEGGRRCQMEEKVLSIMVWPGKASMREALVGMSS